MADKRAVQAMSALPEHVWHLLNWSITHEVAVEAKIAEIERMTGKRVALHGTEPCKYCNGEFKPLLDYDDGFRRLKAYIDGYGIEFLFDCEDDTYDCDAYENIHFCPMCGRDLRKDGE